MCEPSLLIARGLFIQPEILKILKQLAMVRKFLGRVSKKMITISISSNVIGI